MSEPAQRDFGAVAQEDAAWRAQEEAKGLTAMADEEVRRAGHTTANPTGSLVGRRSHDWAGRGGSG